MKINTNTNGLPILEQFSEEGFIDCVFAITQLKEIDNHYYFHMAASYNDVEVGVDVQVVKGIKSGFDAEMKLIKEHVYREGVQFFRSGPESDRLMAAIAQLYEMQYEVGAMVANETFTGIALHQGEIDVEIEPVKIKLFGNDKETDDEEDYYESFFNIDLPQRYVFWNEKDQDYREPLVRALSNAKT